MLLVIFFAFGSSWRFWDITAVVPPLGTVTRVQTVSHGWVDPTCARYTPIGSIHGSRCSRRRA